MTVAVLVAGLLALGPSQPTRAADTDAPGWRVRTLDAPKQFEAMGPRSLALDAAGNPHVAYGSDRLYYAWFDGAFWQYAVVDPAPGTGKFAAIALGPDGAPHFLYYDAAGQQVRYATRDGAGWRTETVQAGVTLDATAGLALDATGAAHAAYRDAGTGAVIYGQRAAGGWTRETVEDAAGGAVALVLSGDIPHLIYGTGVLRHAARGGGGWATQTVDASGVQTGRSLALDSNGTPQAAYTGTNAEGRAELRLAKLTRTGWDVQIVDSVLTRELGFEPSLRLDRNDYAHISYRAYNGLKYARWTGSEWFRQVVDAAGGRDTSLSLDQGGAPHITYRRGLELVYVKRPGLNWTFRTLDTARTTGTHVALAVDAGSNAHVSYRDTETGALRYARQAGEDWVLQVADATPGLPGHTALALHDDRPAVAYYVYADATTPGKLQYARWTGSRWEVATIDGDIGLLATSGPKKPALRFNREGSPRVAYFDGSDMSVRLASLNGGGWSAVAVAGPTQTGEDISLALDDAGAARLSYYDAAADALLYVIQDGAGWQSSPVAEGSLSGDHNALALDATGGPHLCFSRNAEEDSTLRYARRAGTSWVIEPVAGGAAAAFCSLALAAGDSPHIAFYDAAAGELRYAERNGGWTVETVDSDGDVGRYVALALSAGAAPRVAYADVTAGDLKFAARETASACPATPTPRPPYAGTPPASGTIRIAVSHCMDDAYVIHGSAVELRYDSTMVRTGGQAAPAQPYTRYVGGFLFRDIRIPRGAAITAARLKLSPTGQQTGSPIPLQVAGELSEQAVDFNPLNPWLHERPRTAARASWTLAAAITQPVDSPDLSGIVQEIVAQEDWQAGNDLALFLDPLATGSHTIDWQAYELAAGGAAELTVSYALAPASPTPTATASATATASPTPTATSTATATATLTSTATATPTATAIGAERQTYLPLVLRP